jgi:hypothetical protein
VFYVFINWVKTCNNGRILFTVIFFYSTRAFIQGVFKFQKDPGLYWESPGFPSLTVPYGMTSDFYPSGHIGFLTISAMELAFIGKKKMFFLPATTIIFMSFILICFRTHYSIDIPIGCLWAIQCSFISKKLTPYLAIYFRKYMFTLPLIKKLTVMPTVPTAQSVEKASTPFP